MYVYALIYEIHLNFRQDNFQKSAQMELLNTGKENSVVEGGLLIQRYVENPFVLSKIFKR